jgi:hypothetical protein
MFRLELPEPMVGVIINALAEYRYRDAAPVLQELQRQINVQHAQSVQNAQNVQSALRPATNGKDEHKLQPQ